MLLWKEQKEEILEYIDSISEEEKENYRIAIRIILREIELRSRSKTLSNRKFFRNRALVCYKLAYIKTRMPKEFDEYRNMLCNQ
jgi:hypothetical protein